MPENALLSATLKRASPSATLEISQKVRELRTAGMDVIGLSQGEPDFDTPDHIKEGAHAAIRYGKTKYTNVDGIPELKEAIRAKFKRDNNLEFQPQQINVSPGGKPVIFNALIATLNPGDEVIIPTPCWVSYPDIVKLAGGSPVFAPSAPDTNFKLTPDLLERAITPQTKWLILNSPSNPTGVAYTALELEHLSAVLRSYPNVWILSDDMYEHIIYDGFEYSTLAQIAPDLGNRILTMNGVSKAYAMTGWRIGYAGGPTSLINGMAKVMSQSTSNAASISQWAAVAALNGQHDFIEERNAVFKERRDLALRLINECDGLSCTTPNGAFYIFPDCSRILGKKTQCGFLLQSDLDFTKKLLEQESVAVVPGTAFYSSPFFRISYSIDTERLNDACLRIQRFCNSLL